MGPETLNKGEVQLVESRAAGGSDTLSLYGPLPTIDLPSLSRESMRMSVSSTLGTPLEGIITPTQVVEGLGLAVAVLGVALWSATCNIKLPRFTLFPDVTVIGRSAVVRLNRRRH